MPLQSSHCIETCAVTFSHAANDPTTGRTMALDGITVEIAQGEFVAVIGRNGSGKTTFARMLNALLLPTGGSVRIHGVDTRDESQIWAVRSRVGMIFQDPDSQIVGTTVEEDVAFGPENQGMAPPEIRENVQEALQAVAMLEHLHASPQFLSGGEKQKVSLAGILAMQPECIILDEATALLDPTGRKEVMALVRRLNREKGLTVLHITHDMEEASLADRVMVLDAGRIILDGTPEQVFTHKSALHEAGLELPQVAELFALLNKDGLDLPGGALPLDEALAALTRGLSTGRDKHVDQH